MFARWIRFSFYLVVAYFLVSATIFFFFFTPSYQGSPYPDFILLVLLVSCLLNVLESLFSSLLPLMTSTCWRNVRRERG